MQAVAQRQDLCPVVSALKLCPNATEDTIMPVEVYQADNGSISMELTDETSLNNPPGADFQNLQEVPHNASCYIVVRESASKIPKLLYKLT